MGRTNRKGFANSSAPDPAEIPAGLIRYELNDLLFHLERDLADGRLLACDEGLLAPDERNPDLRAAIEATARIRYQLPGHQQILRLCLRYAAKQRAEVGL